MDFEAQRSGLLRLYSLAIAKRGLESSSLSSSWLSFCSVTPIELMVTVTDFIYTCPHMIFQKYI